MKERKRKINIFFALVASAIIILSIFTVITQYQVSDLTTTAREKESLPLLVSISADKTSGTIPLEVGFTPIVSNAVGTLKYHWDFGDGNISKETNPTYIYRENGTFVCNLTVIDDNGKKGSNSIEMSVIGNRKPTVSIEKPTPNARRPLIFWFEWMPESIHFDSYTGGDYWYLRDKGRLPKSFTNRPGFYTVTASANDLDGDEIVNYTWILNPPEYTNRRNEVMKWEFIYYGQTITFPLADIYPNTYYDLKCIVTDSEGNTGEASTGFKTQKSFQKDKIDSFKSQIEHFRTTSWNDILADAARPFIRDRVLLQLLFPILEKLPVPGLILLIEIIIIKKTANWKIFDITEVVPRAIESIKPFLEKRPMVKELANNTLAKLEEKLGELLEKDNIGDIIKSSINNIIYEIQQIRETLDLGNKRPVISDPFPESGSINIPVDCPHVSITVEDPEGDPFNVTISGIYVDNITYSGQYNGTFTANLINPLPETEEITWKVEVVDENGRYGIYTINQNGKIIIIPGPSHNFKFKTLY